MFAKRNSHIRVEIYLFCIFVAAMLFQTSYRNLGTIVAGSIILLTVLVLFLKYKSIRMDTVNILLVLFVSEMLFSGLLGGRELLGKMSFWAQIVLFIFLSYVSVSENENRVIRNIFELSCTFYSVVIIYSCIVNANIRYIHSGLIMFGTVIDPNFAAIPLVAATVLILDHIVKKEKLILNISKITVVFAAIMFTSSRAAFAGLIVALFLFVCLKLFSRDVSLKKTLLFVFLSVAIIILFVYMAEQYFPEQWERMINIAGDTDGGNGRVDLWKRSFSEWSNHPVFGIGLGGVVEIYGKATHNTYLQVLTETGLVGFILFGSFIICLFLRVRKIDPILCVAFCGLLVQIAFVDALQDRCYWCVLIWIALLPDRRFEETSILS